MNRSSFDVLLVNFSPWLGVARLPRLLAMAGARVHVFASPDTYVLHSGYCERMIKAPGLLAEFVSAFRQFVVAEGTRYKWIILADDTTLLELSNRVHEPWARACLPVSSPDAMALLVDKAVFPEIAARHGLPVPHTSVVTRYEDALAFVADWGYPAILKPVHGFGGKQVARIESDDDLHREMEGHDVPMVIQQFMPGQLCSGTALYQHGELRFWAVYERVKTHRGPYGPSTMVRFVAIPAMATILQQLGRITGFHGLCGVDFIHQRKLGVITLLEMNGRPTPQASLYIGRRRGGIETQLRAMLDAAPLPNSTPTAARTRGAVAIFPQDVCRSICERDYSNLLRWAVTPSRWADLPWREFALLREHARLIARDLLGR